MKYLYIYNAKGERLKTVTPDEVFSKMDIAYENDMQYALFSNDYKSHTRLATMADIIIDIEDGRIIKSRFTGASPETASVDEDDDKSPGMIHEYIAEISPHAANIEGRVTDADVEKMADKFIEDIKLILLYRARDYVIEDLGKMGYTKEWAEMYHNAVITTGIKSAIDDIINNK